MTVAHTPWYKRTTFRIVISAALLLACLYFVDMAQVVEALVKVDPWYFTLAFALNAIGTVVVRAWVAHITTHASGLTLGFGELIRINFIARFYTIILPRGASAAVRWHHYRKGGSGHAAAALLLFENLVSVFMLFLSAAVILAVETDHAGQAAQFLLPLSWIGTVVTAGVLLPFLHTRSARVFQRLLKPLTIRPGWMATMTVKLLDAVTAYQALSTRRIGWIFFASLSGYVMFVLSAWVLAIGMNLGIALVAIAWVRSVTLLTALVPITVAGIGLRETMLIALLRDYGITASTAFAYAMVSFVIQLLLGLLGGLLELVRILGKKDKPPTNEINDGRA